MTAVWDENAPRIVNGLDGPQRLEPIAVEALGEREIGVIDRLRATASGPEPGHPGDFMLTLSYHPVAFEAYMQLGILLLDSPALPRRDCELLIMRTGWLCDAPFAFGEHVHRARDFGITEEEIERIPEGSQAEGWSRRDRALLQAAEELHEGAMIGDETWAVLSDYFDERQMVELLLMIGHYHTTAYMQNSLRIRPRRDRSGRMREWARGP